MKTKKSDAAMTAVIILWWAVVFLVAASVMPMTSYNADTKGLRVVPDILFANAAVLGAVEENRRRAGVSALVAGVLCDIFLMPPLHMSPLLFAVCAYEIPRVFHHFGNKNALSAAVSALPFFAARAVCGGIWLFSEHKGLALGEALFGVLLPELLWNFIAAAVLYYPVYLGYRYCARRLS